ncbi:MAG TPA: hypothetical protein GYA10_10495, partial [Alphaproteobacteria bacterium]|nr:hypothetical protein [Alphaproteobacteria bacterium]
MPSHPLSPMLRRCAALAAGIAAFAGVSPASAQPWFTDATALLDQPAGRKFSMGAAAADLDGDGRLDLAIASEYAPNRVLFGSAEGRLRDLSDARLARRVGDHEDVAIADFDGDGDLDLVFVGEDDGVYGYHLNDGCGVFTDVTWRLPRRGVSNAVADGDFDGDGDVDLMLGNNGQDFLFFNDGEGHFVDATLGRLPPSADITQDVAAGDVDGDGDLDLLLGNEDGNALLSNDGSGRFARSELGRRAPEETRDADLADVDGDGDPDLYFANTALFTAGADPQDRLLLNEGTGGFTDVTATHLVADRDPTMTAAFLDYDGDGDLDLVTGSLGDLDGGTALA